MAIITYKIDGIIITGEEDKVRELLLDHNSINLDEYYYDHLTGVRKKMDEVSTPGIIREFLESVDSNIASNAICNTFFHKASVTFIDNKAQLLWKEIQNRFIRTRDV